MRFTEKVLYFIKQPEKVFLLLSMVFGSFYLALSPPFQVPDTPCHFYRAYQVSEGKFVADKINKRVGGFLPESLLKLETIYRPVIAGYKFTQDSIFERSLRIPLNQDTKIFIDFNNTALYAPFCYFPQAVGIFILRLFDASPLVLLYGGSFFALVAWSLFVFISIKIIPVGKWLMCFVALLPMSMHVNSSFSADCMTNSIAFLLLAFLLNTAYGEGKPTARRLAVICTLLFILPLVKPIFISLLLLVFMIPVKKYVTRKKQLLCISLFFVTAFVPYLLWSNVIKEYYLSYEQYNTEYRNDAALIPGVDANKQLEFVKEDKSVLLTVLWNSFKLMPDYHIPGYIGTFGWLSVKPPDWFSYGLFCCILLVSFFENNNGIKIPWHVKCIFILTFFISVSCIFIGLFLTWFPVRGDLHVNFFQGRYLAPVYPLIFLCLNALFPLRKPIIPIFVITVSVASLLYCSLLIYERYY
jgi:uncharacterized membrane protein